MLAYPIAHEDDAGNLRATSPDFPELTIFGDHREGAIAARIHDRKDIPKPPRGETGAILATLTSFKEILYQGIRDQGVGKAELARRLGWHTHQVNRVLDLQHRSRLASMATALKSFGWQLHVPHRKLPTRPSRPLGKKRPASISTIDQPKLELRASIEMILSEAINSRLRLHINVFNNSRVSPIHNCTETFSGDRLALASFHLARPTSFSRLAQKPHSLRRT